uniref:RING-type domain-containing protein n=1 Tax=Plectus sambesii TaxID=2011161 RepID=A0A914V9E6_9BILA
MQNAYQQLFRWLNSALEHNKSVSTVQTILIDFEPAAKKAFELKLHMADREIAIKGCHFHFGQAVSHNFNKKGLKLLHNNKFKIWKQQLLGLPLLLPHRQFKRFFAYFENQWLNSDDYITHWNHWDNNLCRTTNSAEGWHSALKATWSGARPVLSTYVEWLKKKEVEHATQVTQLNNESFPMKKRVAAYVLLDERIHKAKVRFVALEVLELSTSTPDMLLIILQHLRYVSSLMSNKNVAAPAFPLTNPASISLFEPVDSIDAISAAVGWCPALVHTYLPPCTHQRPALTVLNDDLDLSDLSIIDSSDEEVKPEAAPELVYEPCKECGDRMADTCLACKHPVHFSCGGMSNKATVSICEPCCLKLGDVSEIIGRMAHHRKLERRLAPFDSLPLKD